MKCPVCLAPMAYRGGENKKDFGCTNTEYCSSRSEIHYYPHLSVRPDWYFCEAYHLPFKSGNKWFALIGPEGDWDSKNRQFKEKTILQEIIPSNNVFLSCTQVNLISINYMALPANDDMYDQFKILVERAMGRLAIK